MVKKHDNVVIIKSKHIDSIEFVDGSVMATKGQPVDIQPRIDIGNGVVTIVLGSGRKKSGPVAQKFISLSGEGNMFAPQGGRGGKPKELNFMFSVRITLKDGSVHDVHLGQGSNGPRNNWWMGSPSLLSIKEVTGTSMKTSVGKAYDKLGPSLPEPFDQIHSFLGKLFSKDLFEAVNMFEIK